MALHHELPIYKTGVDLLELAIKVQAQMPRCVKRSLGDKIAEHCVQMLNLMALANSTRHAQRALPAWVRALRDQCAGAGVAFHFKQWGEWAPARDAAVIDRGEGIGGRLTNSGSLEITPNTMQRLGKKTAGRLLDGVEYNAFPEAACGR
jgi:hypothetical protein